MAEADIKKEIAKAILKDRVILTGYITAMRVEYETAPMYVKGQYVGSQGAVGPKMPKDVKIDLTISADSFVDSDVFHSATLGSKKILIMEIE